MTKQITARPLYLATLFVIVASFFWGASAHGLTTISESYDSDTQIPVGSLVSLVKNTSDKVQASLSSNVDNLLGVVVNPNNSLLSVTTAGSNHTEVATSGTLDLLVSDVNGPVVQGDHITASPLAGIGMKANGNVRVVGIAQGGVSGTHETTVKDGDGKDQKVTLGQVPVLINVAYFFKEPDKSIIPAALQSVANSLAGKTVQPLPIIVGAGIFLVTLIVVMSIIFTMIRSSIISVGRNPMSQSAVYRDVIQLSALVLGILAVATIAIYMVLTRL